jgi:hypothetical protein
VKKPDGVPEEYWLPIIRKDEDIGAIMRIHVPDLEKCRPENPHGLKESQTDKVLAT